jgi:hypothetical protein
MDASGKPCKVVKFAQDISWQVTAAQALKEAVTEAQFVLGAPRDGVPSHSISTESRTSELASLCSDLNALVKNLVLKAAGAEFHTKAATPEFSAPAKAAASVRRSSPVNKQVKEPGSRAKPGAFLKKVAIDEWEGF